MPNYNPFNEKKEKKDNWFLQSAVKAAAFTGTAFGLYSLWKFSGPARRILEKAVDDRTRRIIAEEAYRNGDKLNEILKGYSESIQETTKEMWDAFQVKDSSGKIIDVSKAWDLVDTPLRTKRRIMQMEGQIIRRLEEDASYLAGASRSSQKIPPGSKFDKKTWFAINKSETWVAQKTVKLSGTEAEQLGRVRQQALLEFYNTYGKITADEALDTSELDILSTYFSSNEYLQGGRVSGGEGKQYIDRVSTIHNSLMNDKRYADIYYDLLSPIHRAYVLTKHAEQRPKIPKSAGTVPIGRQYLYGNIVSHVFDDDEFKAQIAPKVEELFDGKNSNAKLRRISSMGAKSWGPTNRFSILQETVYTGHIENIRKELVSRKETGEILDFSVSIADYGTATSPEKRLVISLVHPDVLTYQGKDFRIEVPLGIDGRMPGATPGLQQVNEKFHIVGDDLGFNNGTFGVINTTEKNLISVARLLKTSLISGTKDTFKDSPLKAIKQINTQIANTLEENAASRGNFYDLLDAMSIDNPVFRDLIDSSRKSHPHAVKTVTNYLATAKNIKEIAKLRKKNRRAVVINIDLETLDNTAASPGKALLSRDAQIVKTGIVVQDVNNGMIRYTSLKSNNTGLRYFDTMEKWEKGSGYNARMVTWMNKGVLPDAVPAGQVRDAYKALLDREKAAGNWLEAVDRKDVVQKTAAEIQKLKRRYEAKGYQVFIGTKNGYEFDLRPFEQDAQDFYRQIIGSVVDAQAIGAFQNAALGENNGLRLEQMIKTLMGRLGHDVSEFKRGGLFDMESEYGVRNILKALKKSNLKVQNGNMALINWKNETDPFNFQGKKMTIKAHQSPRSDAGLGAALTMSIVGDYEAGHLNFLNDTEGVQNLLHAVTSGPIDPNTWSSLFTYLNNKTLEGMNVISFSASSQGLVQKLIANTVHLNELSPFADPLNVGVRRRLAGLPTLGLSKYYQRLASGSKDPIAFTRRYLGRFMTTNTVEDGNRIILDRFNTPRATDMKNNFATSALAKVFYALEPEIEPYIALTEGFTKRYKSTHFFNIYSDTLKGDHVFNNQIMLFYKKVQAELKKANIINPSKEQLEAIQQIVAAKERWSIPLDSQIFSASSYGGSVKFPHRATYGRIVAVEMDPDRVGTGRNTVPRFIVKIEYQLDGFNTFKGAQLQLPGTHAVATKAEALADAQAHGGYGIRNYDILASAEFLKKGHVGAAKEILMSNLLRKLYDDILGSKDKHVRRAAASLIKEIRAQLKAKVNVKHNLFIRDTSSIGSSTDLAVKALGDVDLRIGQITEWYRRAGVVWNKEEMKDLYDKGYKGEVHKLYYDMFTQISEKKDNVLLEEFEVLKGLTPEQLGIYKEEVKSMRDLFNWELDNPGVRIIDVAQYKGSNRWRVGISAYQDVTIYNHDMEVGRNQNYVFRHDYYLGLKHTYHGKNTTTMDFLARHTFASRNDRLKSVIATYRRFIDVTFAKELTQDKMNIDQINFLTDIKQKIELQSQMYGLKGTKTWGDMGNGALALAKADRDNFLKLNKDLLDNETKTRYSSEMKEISDVLGKRTGGTKLFDSVSRFSKVYSEEEVAVFDKLAKENKGVLVFNLPTFKGNNVHVINIEETMRRQLYTIMGENSLSEHEVKGLTAKLVSTLSDAADMSRKDAPLRFDKETGNLHLGAAILDWDPTRGNLFEAIGPGVFKPKEHTQIKIDMLEALKEWQTVATKMNKSKEQLSPSDKNFFDAKADKFFRMFLRHLMVGLNADKLSEFWQAGQYAPNGLHLMHKNINNIHANILNLERTKPGAFKRYEATIKLIKEATFDTVLINETQFKNFRYVDQITGHNVSAAREMEKKLGSDYTNISKGRAYLPGGILVRHPVPQAGYDGIRTNQFLVIPKPLAKMIGVDDNSFFANPVYTSAQGGDFDGDHFYLHLKELGVIYGMDELKKADTMTREDVLKLAETQELLKQNEIVQGQKVKIGQVNSILFHEGDNTWVSGLDLKGRTVQKIVKTKDLDLTSMVDHSIKLLSNLAERAKAGDITSRQLNALTESAASTLIAKHMIPLTTNLLKTRVNEILIMNAKNPGSDFSEKFMMFVGNLNHGLAGMAQGTIDAAKDANEARKIANIYAWLQDPTKKRQEAKTAWFEMREKQMGKRYDLTLETSVWDEFSTQLENFHIARKSTEKFKIVNKQVIDFTLGRTGASLMDSLRTFSEKQFEQWVPSAKRSAMDELNDALSRRAGRSIDVSPVFRKVGKYGAIGAAVFLGLSMFTPFGNSKSLNPIDMFIDLGHVDGDRASINSPLELPRSVPLNMVDASFSKQAYIRIKDRNKNYKKDSASIINKLLMGSMLSRGDSIYEFEDKPHKTYSNYTKGINTIGSNELDRRANII